MPYTAYIEKNFSAATEAVIAQADAICREYARAGYVLTLRQLYYQFVARDLIPNRQSEYKRLGKIVSDARMAGLINWDAIEDRGRDLEENAHWENPRHILHDCTRWFGIDKWENQPYRVEVWVEKAALLGIIEPVCREFDIACMAMKGYGSSSELWRAAKRFHRYEDDSDQRVVVLHLGDHDPSGIDMTRDNQDRLRIFESQAEVRRIALNMNQVEEHSPPPNPVKFTDSRATGYEDDYGTSCWELDALNPEVLTTLVSGHIFELRDHELWDEKVEEEDQMREHLTSLVDTWKD